MGWPAGDGTPVIVMLILNVQSAVMTALVKAAMDDGMDPLVLVTLQQLLMSLFLSPIAYFSERKARPKFTLEIFVYFFFSAALGAALRQYLIFIGLRYTTATFATAFSNISPVMTFLLAVALRSETLDLRSKSGAAKLLGTLISLGGAMVLTLYKGVALTHTAARGSHRHGGSTTTTSSRWTVGTVAILGNCICLSSWFLLQSKLITKKYPPVYSCNAIMSIVSFFQVAVIGACARRDISVWVPKGKLQIIAVLYAGIIGCGLGFVMITWCIRKRGAVFAAAFIPVMQIIVAGIDFSILHEQLYLGSVVGSVLVILGLYLLLWGKNKEALPPPCPPKLAEEEDKEQQQLQL